MEATEAIDLSDALTKFLVALFGAGGLVSLVKTVIDYRKGRSQKEAEVNDKYLARLERRITYLEREREKDMLYQADLIRALAAAGVDVPARR